VADTGVLLILVASGIASGLVFLPRASWLAAVLGRSLAKSSRRFEKLILQLKERTKTESIVEHSDSPLGQNESSVEWLTPETQEPVVEASLPLPDEDISLTRQAEELESCPCGLVLPSDALVEHRESCGHAGIISFANVRAGKIWDLEQAIIEGTSPDCYKCGKPVKGLKRVGKTIYVSHLGCIDATTRNMRTGKKSSGQAENPTSDQTSRAVRVARRKRCPICWRLVRRKGSITALSSTGILLRIHHDCLRREALNDIVRVKIGGKPLRKIMN